MEKFNNKIEKHLELSEIAEMLKEYKKYYNVYRRLLVIHMVANGESIAKASKNINIFRKTGEQCTGIFNKTFPLRRKTMITGDAEYMVRALDIYDEMLKGQHQQTYEKVKPYQRRYSINFRIFMNVALF